MLPSLESPVSSTPTPSTRVPSARLRRAGVRRWDRVVIATFGWLLAVASQGAAQPSTDIIVLDLYPHLDHVHVGSMIRVTDRDGYDNQPSFVDHDRLLFVSDREGGRTEVFMYTISTGALERVTDTPEAAEYSPRVAPGGAAISVVRVEADGTSQHLVRYPAAFLGRDRGGEPGGDAAGGERLGAPLDDIGYYAWAGAGRVAVYRVGEPSSLHLVELASGEARLVRERVGSSVQSIPRTTDVSFVDVEDPERPVLSRLEGATGEVEEVAELPPGVVEHAWLSDITAYMGHEGTLYRSTSDPETPWYPILELGEAVGTFSRIAVTSGGRRIAVVVERDAAVGGSAPEADRSSFPEAEPEGEGVSAAALQRITEAMEAHVEVGDVAGVVAAVMRDGKRVYHQAVGYRDLESGDPMPLDAHFRIYSMTRPVTAAGILLLEQDVLLDLDVPLETYLPEFAGQRVFEDPSDTDLERTRPRRGPVTLAQLLLHTSEIGSRSSALYRAHDVHGWYLPLEEVVNRVAALPLFEDSGTAFRYGMHSEVLGRAPTGDHPWTGISGWMHEVPTPPGPEVSPPHCGSNPDGEVLPDLHLVESCDTGRPPRKSSNPRGPLWESPVLRPHLCGSTTGVTFPAQFRSSRTGPTGRPVKRRRGPATVKEARGIPLVPCHQPLEPPPPTLKGRV